MSNPGFFNLNNIYVEEKYIFPYTKEMLEDTRMFINRVIKPYNGSRCGPRADNPRAVVSFFLVTLHNVTQASVW